MSQGLSVQRRVCTGQKLSDARDLWWSCKPPQLTRLKKDDPSTWIGGFTEEEHSSDDENNVSSGHWGCRMVGGSDAFLDMLPRACWGAVEQLCGAGTMIEPDGVTKPGANFAHPGANQEGVGSPGRASRGVYCNLPADISPEERAIPKLKFAVMGGFDCVSSIMQILAVNFVPNASTLARPRVAPQGDCPL